MFIELIEFVIPNLNRIYLCIPDIFKRKFKLVFKYKSPFEFVFLNAVDSQRLLCSQKAGVKC